MSSAGVEGAVPPMEQEDLGIKFDALKAAYRSEPFPSLEVRKQRLEALLGAVRDRRDQITSVIAEDFGHRSRHESWMADVTVVATNLRYVLKHLARWMAPEPRPTSIALQPARARIVPQPKGVVGVISPWNYPVQLALVPLTYALAAGNRVMIKPSERTPRTSELLADLLSSIFPGDLVSVVTGGPAVGEAFSSLPFDHLLFTGSEGVGRKVLVAAAQHLTPVTLELGGKSPAMVHPSARLGDAAQKILAGKLYNAGQTCVAPDYVLVRRDRADALVEAMRSTAVELGVPIPDNPDMTALIDDRHRARLDALLQDAQAKGARVLPLREGGVDAVGRYPLTLVRDVTPDMRVMEEEIFGPILPVVEVETWSEAIDHVNAGPRPLALYVFDRSGDRIEELLHRTHAGGVTVNDTLLHAAEENLPFGGIGASGMGSYHGREGFDTFSHRKPVLHQPRWNARSLLVPPYSRMLERLLDWLT